MGRVDVDAGRERDCILRRKGEEGEYDGGEDADAELAERTTSTQGCCVTSKFGHTAQFGQSIRASPNLRLNNNQVQPV